MLLKGYFMRDPLADALTRTALKVYVKRGEFKTANAYELHVWSYMREFYTGGVDAFGFIDLMAAEIENQYTRAWNEGARNMGVDPADFTPEDADILDQFIRTEQNFLDGIAGDIEAYIAEGDHTDEEFNKRFRARAALWGNGYNSMVAQAQLHFGNRDKLEWMEGDTQDKCSTCLALDGIVAWAREWEEAGVKPQGSMLECGGWNCGCSLQPTDKRRTANALDKIMTIMTSANV
jgi:hypothetical protein